MGNKFESFTLNSIIDSDSQSFFQTMRLHHFENWSRFCFDWLGKSYISKRELTGSHLVPWELESSKANDELFFQFSKKRILLTYERSVTEIKNMGHVETIARDLLLGFKKANLNPKTFSSLCLILFCIWDLTLRNAGNPRNAYLYTDDEMELVDSIRTGKDPSEILKGLKSILAKKQAEVRSCVEGWDGVVNEKNRESYLGFFDHMNHLASRIEDLSEFFWNPNWDRYLVFLNSIGELVSASLDDEKGTDFYFFWREIRESFAKGGQNIGSICEKQILKCEERAFYLRDVLGKTFPEETPGLLKKIELDIAMHWHWLKLSQTHPGFVVVLTPEPDSICKTCLGGNGIGEHCTKQDAGGSTDKHAFFALSEIMQLRAGELPPEKGQVNLRIPINLFYDERFVNSFDKKFMASIRREVKGCE